MKREQREVWIRAFDSDNDLTFKTKVIAYSVRIKGVALVVHNSIGLGWVDWWNVSDPFSGMRAGPKTLTLDDAIASARQAYTKMEKDLGKTTIEIFKEKREEWGDVMSLPEKPIS
jgi:hypothetical protein